MEEHIHFQMLVVDCSYTDHPYHQRVLVPTSAHRKWSALGETYIVPRLRLPQPDVLARQAHNVTLGIHDTRPRTARPDVDANVVVLLRAELIVWIGRHLSRLLARRVAEGHGGGSGHLAHFLSPKSSLDSVGARAGRSTPRSGTRQVPGEVREGLADLRGVEGFPRLAKTKRSAH